MASKARATDIATLIGELAVEITTAQADHDRLDALSKSASATEDEAEAAGDQALKIARRMTRLAAKQEQLRARHAEILSSDRQERLRIERIAAIERRDKLAEDLCARWPVLAAEMFELLQRLEHSDAEMDSHREASAEAIARGCPGNFYVDASPVTRLLKARIPALSVEGGGQLTVWPKPVGVPVWFEEYGRALKASRERVVAEEARWKECRVTAPNDGTRDLYPFKTRRGPSTVRRGTSVGADMTDELIAAAQAEGLTVDVRKARAA